jgi:hypothetical protein
VTLGWFDGKCKKRPDGSQVHYFGRGGKCQCGERDAVIQAGQPGTGSIKPDLRVIEGGKDSEDGAA